MNIEKKFKNSNIKFKNSNIQINSIFRHDVVLHVAITGEVHSAESGSDE